MALQLHTIRLSREDSSVPWGFRLEGGTDVGHAVNIQRVNPGSVADQCGLRSGDHVVRINQSDTKWMRHEDAKMEIIRSSNDLEMLVQRGGAHLVQSSAPITMMPSNTWNRQIPQSASPSQQLHASPRTTWQPKILPNEQPSYGDGLNTHTSLESGVQNYDQSSIGVKHNVSPTPFGQVPPAPGQVITAQGSDGRFRQVKHSSYNSPMGLYNKANMTETFERTISSVSHTGFRPIGGAVRPAGSAAPRPDIATKYCGACGDFIRDVFVKVQGRVPMHPECLKCCKCGIGLRNVGYFYINEKLYCERHAKQAAPPPEPGMKPVVVYK
ncbi:PDZ and LIM domain protein Zasp [Fasciola hepatica]|uniref:PDZ and LIM domain protein Zasp n=1 Tax=Fasciola hepatica TaxID=6192 RepID=A0A2H1CZD9_FASHE|nr:PDZ and LIM domain protein Zasp [Fasciola hepatica]